MNDSPELGILIAKIICFSIVLFMTVAAFEAIVINGAKMVINLTYWVMNSANSLLCFEPNSTPLLIDTLPPVQNSPIDDTTSYTELPTDEPSIPPLNPNETVIFDDIVKTLGTEDYVSLWWNHEKRLLDHQNNTKHIHPLQSLSYILKKNSVQKKYFALLFKRDMIRKRFINDTLPTFNDPMHLRNTEKYMPAFARIVEVPLGHVRYYLSQNPPKLYDLLAYILQSS